jgi:hypothetical protein
MTLASSIDWTNVLVALIAGLPAIIAAVGVYLLHTEIRTPSGKSIGKQVEDVNHTTISSQHHLVAISDKVGATQGQDEQPAVSGAGG